jgi:hypothetical protein
MNRTSAVCPTALAPSFGRLGLLVDLHPSSNNFLSVSSSLVSKRTPFLHRKDAAALCRVTVKLIYQPGHGFRGEGEPLLVL